MFHELQSLARQSSLVSQGAVCLTAITRPFATATKSGNLYHLNSVHEETATNKVAICMNEDTKEAIWHRRYGLLVVKNLERLAKDNVLEEV